MAGDASGAREVARLLETGWRIVEILHTTSLNEADDRHEYSGATDQQVAVRFTVVMLERPIP